MGTQKCNYRFVIKVYQGLQGLLQLEIYFSRSLRKRISTGVHIDPSLWNAKKQAVSSKHQQAVKIINIYLILKTK